MTASPGGSLYVVATPIGNLGDITLRALETLRSVPLIAAEDTRVTRRLLTRYEIPTRMVSYHARSGPSREEELVGHLRAGADLALVTDAGTPAISDPGEGLVARWASEGGSVVPIPGASSVLAAVAASGVAGPRWGFEGFLPRSGRERRERLARLAADERGSVLFEAPGRLAATLRDLAAVCGGARAGAVCRELTKLHETISRGTLASLAEAAAGGADPGPGRGGHRRRVGHAARGSDGGRRRERRGRPRRGRAARRVGGRAWRGRQTRRQGARDPAPAAVRRTTRLNVGMVPQRGRWHDVRRMEGR